MTGFEGVERQKVELLIKQLGATYTDYLDQTNTLLVCKRFVPLYTTYSYPNLHHICFGFVNPSSQA